MEKWQGEAAGEEFDELDLPATPYLPTGQHDPNPESLNATPTHPPHLLNTTNLENDGKSNINCELRQLPNPATREREKHLGPQLPFRARRSERRRRTPDPAFHRH